MKHLKINFLALLLIVSAYGLKAQGEKSTDIYNGAFSFGLIHSLNLTYLSGFSEDIMRANVETSNNMISPRFTFDFGMTADYHINKILSVQLDIEYALMGAHFVETKLVYNEIGIIETNNWYKYSMDYFKFPLTVNLYPNDYFYMNAGGYFSTLLSSKKSRYIFDSNAKPIEDISQIDYGFIFGLGLNTPIAKLGFQYTYGFNNIIDSKNADLHNNVFQFVVRWKFYSDIRSRKRK